MTDSNSNSGLSPPEAPKPEEPIAPQTLSIKIKDQSESETFFKIKPTTKLGKVFKSYCERQSIDSHYIRFLFHGSRVQPEQTPADLEMVEGDELQAMVEQQGGDGTPAPNAPGEEQAAPAHLNVKVVDQARNEIFFKIKMHTPLKKVMDAYCERQGIGRGAVRFVVEGERIYDADTPASKEMEDNDTIEVFREQLGGNDDDGNGQDKSKEETKPSISIRLADQARNGVTFKVKFTTSMEKIMNAYASRQGQDLGTLRFFTPDGKRILPTDTPASLDLEDEDVVDVHLFHQGGAGGEDAPKDDSAKTHINITVKNDNNNATFKVKSSTSMEKVMDVFCNQVGKNRDAFRFFTPDGKRIQKTDTPALLELEDGDQLDAHLEQEGGSTTPVKKGYHPSRIGPEHYITFRIQDASGLEIWYKMKPTIRMQKVMNAECHRVMDHHLDFFTADGSRIYYGDTPRSLGLKEGGFIKSSYVGLEQLESDFMSALMFNQ